MTKYLSYKFNDSEEFISTFDEAPLWSASFGLLLLKHLELKRGMIVADVGSGAGFPLLELAARLGNSCRLYGIDPWVNANKRAQQKIRNYGLTNVEIIESSAEKIPLEDGTFDLIVSNLGINNFEQPLAVFKECSRILKPGGRLALTTNLNGHWKEFYSVFETTLTRLGKENLLPGLIASQQHRGTVESISQLYLESGFHLRRHCLESFEMKFLDGSAFLDHYFVKLGWLGSWRAMIPESDQEEVFAVLEHDLNVLAGRSGDLTLNVPMAFMEGEKV